MSHVLKMKPVVTARPDPGTNMMNIKEVLHTGKADPTIRLEIESPMGRELLMEISRMGYPLVKIARAGKYQAVTVSTAKDGAYIRAESTQDGATIIDALKEIYNSLKNNSRDQQQTKAEGA